MKIIVLRPLAKDFWLFWSSSSFYFSIWSYWKLMENIDLIWTREIISELTLAKNAHVNWPKRVIANSLNIFRAHLRLGIHFLSREEPSRAILSLQSVLRSEPANVDAWESLADAYLSRGSLNAALKAYDQVWTSWSISLNVLYINRHRLYT